VRGGKGTSQPNLTIAEKTPAKTPTAAALRIGFLEKIFKHVQAFLSILMSIDTERTRR